MAVTLDPNNPQANFEKEGSQAAVPGAQLALGDSSGTDHVGFYAGDPDAAPNKEIEVAATFRVVTADSASRCIAGS